MDALHAPAMLKYWWALIEIIRWGCTWQRTMATPATPLPAAVQRGWFFITDPISACTSALFSQVCVPAEWRWARVKITLHIHLPNWLLNAATGGGVGWGERKIFWFIRFENAVFAFKTYQSLAALSRFWIYRSFIQLKALFLYLV